LIYLFTYSHTRASVGYYGAVRLRDGKFNVKLVGDFTIEVTPVTQLFIHREGRITRIDIKGVIKGSAFDSLVKIRAQAQRNSI